jgi:hypothetical protein
MGQFVDTTRIASRNLKSAPEFSDDIGVDLLRQ